MLPTHPRVKALVGSGLDALEQLPFQGVNASKLGSKCLAGLALYKAGRPDSPRVAEAIAACVEAQSNPITLLNDNYSHCLAIIFLAEVSPTKHRSLINSLLASLTGKQMGHGGWGYRGDQNGDTSQTQYVALSFWQAHQAGLRVPADAAKGMIDWLNKTQDPSGAWGYHGVIATGSELVDQAKTSPTLAAAGLASLMIGADLHGLLGKDSLAIAGDMLAQGEALPPSVRRVRERVAASKALNPGGVNWGRVAGAMTSGEAWMKRQSVSPSGEYPYYYLYSLERYESFREARVGRFDLEPDWYAKGIDFLEKNQAKPGVWNTGCGAPADTALAVLFMIRSTQKSLQRGIGEGALVSGRGLPKSLATATLRRGQVIVEMDPVGVNGFLALMEQGESDRLDALAADPSAFVVGKIEAADAERLTQILRSGEPDLRYLAARALGRSGDLDSVPALLFGMTDPDRRVAREARDGLRFVARRPRGFGMPDNFTDDERYLALEQWKRWYKTLRPEAIIDVGR